NINALPASIRIRREAAKNRPYYKVVVPDSRSPRDGKFNDILRNYDPKKPDHNSALKLDRIDHWISKGAQPSDTVRSLIKKNKKKAEKTPPETAAPEASAEEASAPVAEAPAAPAAEESAPAAEESAAREEAPTAPATPE